MTRQRLKGFTLIELLVVVAIIALLIAILLPALGKSRQLAQRTRCAATIRGWGSAVAIYQSEYAGWFVGKVIQGSGIYGSQWDQDVRAVNGLTITTLPGTVTDPLNGGASSNAIEGIYSNSANGHVLNAKLRFCSADSGQNVGNNGTFYYGNRPLPSYKFAYYQNANAPGTAPTPSWGIAWNVNSFKGLSNKLLMCDSNSASNYGDLVGYINEASAGGVLKPLISTGTPASPRQPFDSKVELQNRHGGKGNVLFLDGHVDCVNWSDYVKNIPDSPTDGDLSKTWTRLSR